MKEITSTNNLVVVKHNRIIDAEYNMTVFEQRILLTCIAKIDSSKSMDENRVFTVSIDDIVDLVGIRRDSAYSQLKVACATLSRNQVKIELQDGSVTINWMSMVRYIDSQGKVELRFTQEMMPFLTEIKNNFTKYHLSDVLKFKSAYSIRLYELICRWGGGEYKVELSWLREKFKLTSKYARMADFKKDVLDVATKEITERTKFNVTYKVVMQNRRVVAIKFLYTLKQGAKKASITIDLAADDSVKKPTPVKTPIEPRKTNTIDINIEQFNAKEKIIARNALAKVPEASQHLILEMLKSAIAKGDVKSPIRYLTSLVSKELSGDLHVTAIDTNTTPVNDFEKQKRRAEKIREVFAEHTDKMKADLAADGHVFIKGEGSVSKSEFEALGLIEKAPRTISGGKSFTLFELMEKVVIQEVTSKESKAAKKHAKHPKDVADIPIAPMSEKEIVARQKILELEAKLIAAGEFVGVNAMAIGDDEIKELAALNKVASEY